MRTMVFPDAIGHRPEDRIYAASPCAAAGSVARTLVPDSRARFSRRGAFDERLSGAEDWDLAQDQGPPRVRNVAEPLVCNIRSSDRRSATRSGMAQVQLEVLQKLARAVPGRSAAPTGRRIRALIGRTPREKLYGGEHEMGACAAARRAVGNRSTWRRPAVAAGGIEVRAFDPAGAWTSGCLGGARSGRTP